VAADGTVLEDEATNLVAGRNAEVHERSMGQEARRLKGAQGLTRVAALCAALAWLRLSSG
jgi:hypothetical protein